MLRFDLLTASNSGHSIKRAAALLGLGLLLASPLSGADLFDGVDAYWGANYERADAIFEALDRQVMTEGELQVYLKFRAATSFALEQPEDARRSFEELLRIDPEYELDSREFAPELIQLLADSRLSLADAFREEGVDAYRSEDYANAIEKLEMALAFDPGAPSVEEFLALARSQNAHEELVSEADEPVEEPEPEPEPVDPCEPVRVWTKIRKGKACTWVNYAAKLPLPVEIDRVTLIYHEHHLGMGDCFAVRLEDENGELVYEFVDPEGAFADKEDPPEDLRWQVVELPSPRVVRTVKVRTSSAALSFGRSVKILSDEMLLSLERVCANDTEEPVDS